MCEGGVPLKIFLFISCWLICTSECHARLAVWPANSLQQQGWQWIVALFDGFQFLIKHLVSAGVEKAVCSFH